MDFLKKHYEKIILSVVLLGVVGALVALPFVIAKDKQEMDDMKVTVSPKPKPLDPLDMTAEDAILRRVQAPYDLDLATTNKLFNPVMWKKTPSGDLLKVMTGHEIDAEAAVVTKITPLYLILSLESIETNVGARYVIGVERQAALNKSQQRKRTHYASVGDKNDVFTLTKVKGDPVAPDELDLKLADTGEIAVIVRDKDAGTYKPFERVDDYSADIKFDLEKKSVAGRRVNSLPPLNFGDEKYNIVAITDNSVTLQAQSNSKKTILHYIR